MFNVWASQHYKLWVLGKWAFLGQDKSIHSEKAKSSQKRRFLVKYLSSLKQFLQTTISPSFPHSLALLISCYISVFSQAKTHNLFIKPAWCFLCKQWILDTENLTWFKSDVDFIGPNIYISWSSVQFKYSKHSFSPKIIADFLHPLSNKRKISFLRLERKKKS